MHIVISNNSIGFITKTTRIKQGDQFKSYGFILLAMTLFYFIHNNFETLIHDTYCSLDLIFISNVNLSPYPYFSNTIKSIGKIMNVLR